MTATFLVKVEIMDATIIPDTALDIEEDLIQGGHDVISVEPWARPALGFGVESSNPFGEGENPPSLF